jgi:hypothetical protein
MAPLGYGRASVKGATSVAEGVSPAPEGPQGQVGAGAALSGPVRWLLLFGDNGRTLQGGECVTRVSRALTGDRARVIAFPRVDKRHPCLRDVAGVLSAWESRPQLHDPPSVRRKSAAPRPATGGKQGGAASFSGCRAPAEPSLRLPTADGSPSDEPAPHRRMSDGTATTTTTSANNASAPSRTRKATEVDLHRRH